ncbi:MAG: DUF445 family protein [Thermodesulfobacteriota bacterium]
MFDPQLAASLAPPLVGAIAGYTASRLALFLLFKPQKPWRLFGLRLPLTPGAFAAGRHQLAAAVGEAMGSHLLHREAVEKAMADPLFQEHLRHLIERRLAGLLTRNLGPAATLVPNRFRTLYETGGKVLRLRFQQLLHAHLDSPAFADTLRQEMYRHGTLSGPEAEQALAMARSPQCKRLIDTLLADLLLEKVLARPIGPMARLLPTEVQEGLASQMVREAAALLASVLPVLANSLNLPATAAQRIEELDPRQYEALLRQAMGRRANLLALLGALLGLATGAAATLLATAI